MIYTEYFSLCIAEHKFSDWDIHCSTKDNVCDISLLKDMEFFIRSFDGFSNPGLILTSHPVHINEKYHFIDSKNILQFMAFTPDSKFAPFIDIHVENILPMTLKDAYAKVVGNEFIDWIIVTYWRKRRNGAEAEMLSWLLDIYILPVFPAIATVIKEDPILFCESHLTNRGFDQIINFLKGA